jgi:hypothetical protein
VLVVLVLLGIVGIELIVVPDFSAPARAAIRERFGPQLQQAGLLRFFEEKNPGTAP